MHIDGIKNRKLNITYVNTENAGTYTCHGNEAPTDDIDFVAEGTLRLIGSFSYTAHH